MAVVSSAEAAAGPYTFKNCTALNKKFPHGVGRPNAKDKTSGTPVRNFHKSKAWYNKNTKSDRDKDGIACEKR
ncbi:excalibur calcium-binding domain-containing protein [Nocardioides daphniae]|nr:excalibur calcium-binding domain-containing protein [Nocardioides daphniae]